MKHKKIKFSWKTAHKILDLLESGINSKQQHQDYPDEIPDQKTVYKWKREHPEFGEMYDESYGCYVEYYLDELDYISRTPVDILFPDTEFKQAVVQQKARIDALKFQLRSVAPYFLKKLANQRQAMMPEKDKPVVVAAFSNPLKEVK